MVRLQMAQENWFETWFDTPYYHLLYQNRNEQEAEFFIRNLIQELDMNTDCQIADIPCGKGRHAIFLNKMGFEVTGLDLSPSSIKSALQHQNNRLHFAVHDMRQVYQPASFDIILNLFTSLGYFDTEQDNQQVIQSFYHALKPKGQLVIDFFNPGYICSHLQEKDEQIRGQIAFRITKKIENKRIIKNIEVHTDDQIYRYQEKVQLLTLADLENMLKTSGFKILNLFGNYALDSFDELKSERLIMKAVKAS